MKLAVKRAFLSALIYPGLGQLKNGDKAKGWFFVAIASFLVVTLIVLAGLEMVLYFKTVMAFSYPESPASVVDIVGGFWGRLVKLFAIFLLAGLVVWGAAGLDAYYAAKKRWGDIEESDLK